MVLCGYDVTFLVNRHVGSGIKKKKKESYHSVCAVVLVVSLVPEDQMEKNTAVLKREQSRWEADKKQEDIRGVEKRRLKAQAETDASGWTEPGRRAAACHVS